MALEGYQAPADSHNCVGEGGVERALGQDRPHAHERLYRQGVELVLCNELVHQLDEVLNGHDLRLRKAGLETDVNVQVA